MRRFLIAALLVLAAATQASTQVLAHASLVTADPSDHAVLPHPPPAVTLRFNEPVSPLAIRLVGPRGETTVLSDVTAEDAAVRARLPASLGTGSHLLSWRVISADGHPVGGVLTFSIGAPTTAPAAQAETRWALRAAIWAVKLILYLGLLAGVGGAFFTSWIAERQHAAADVCVIGLLIAGVMAVPLSVGLQGLDVLELPLAEVRPEMVWLEGLATAYGATAITAAFALLVALIARTTGTARSARILSLWALLAAGVALALSGHASTAPPQAVSRVALAVHGICVAFWIGALLPLAIELGRDGASGAILTHDPDLVSTEHTLARFSRLIPLPLLLLLASGGWLTLAQLDRIDALWRTAYGQVLAGKLAAVALLLALAAGNRYRLTPRVRRGEGRAHRLLRASIAAELLLVVAILAVVALWRFTPPPRALAVTAPLSLHLHGDKAMAEITIARAAGQQTELLILDGAFAPLPAQEVVLVLANPDAGIEPMRRAATRMDATRWRVDDLTVPVAGRWTLRVEILVSDFDKLAVEDTVALPRLP